MPCVREIQLLGKFPPLPKGCRVKANVATQLRREDLVVKRSTTVCSRHFVSTDIVQGGRRRLKEGAVPVLFAWNNYSQPAAGPEDGAVQEDTDAKVLHQHAARPEPASKIIDAQQLEVEELKKRLEEVSLKQSFGLERFSASDDDIRFYTRFASYHHLLAFWHQIEPATKRIVRAGTHLSVSSATAAPDQAMDPPHQPTRCLPMIDELFLFLMYLSLGLNEIDLGDSFNIHQSTVGEIIKTWVNFLYTLLGAVGIWMSPDKIKATMPSVFGKYSDTQVIIDCAELRCQMPLSLLSQSEMVSHCKSHSTLKGMVGVSPHGAITFISSLHSGSISDRELFRKSGIIPLLDKDMAVMVNKTFRIEDLVPCKVYRPPKDFVQLWIHSERAIRHIKKNKIFDTVIPPTIADSVNQLFAVACLLTNYQNKPKVKAWDQELS